MTVKTMSKKTLKEITEELKNNPGIITTMPGHSVNDCANTILDQMDPNEQDYYRNIALENGYEIWQLLASILV